MKSNKQLISTEGLIALAKAKEEKLKKKIKEDKKIMESKYQSQGVHF